MFGTYEAEYDRNRVLLRGFSDNGVEVLQCHVPVWETMRYKTRALKGPVQYVRVVLKLTLAYLKLALCYLRAPAHDIVFVGYLGHFDVFMARALSKLRRKPLVFDAFVSLYDTAVEDRALFGRRSALARLLRQVDRWACKLSDVVLLDTNQHIDYFCEELGLDRPKFQRVLVGADPAYAVTEPETPTSDPFVVLHYGKFAPLHGMSFIVDAAHHLKDRPEIVFRVVGGGQTFDESRARAERLGLSNIELVPWIEPSALPKAIREAHVCLGIFGNTPKASRVVPNKVYQCLAAGATVVTGRSPAAEELLVDREHVLLCEMGSGRAIADAILELQGDPQLRERLGRNGALLYRKRFTPKAIVGTELLPRLERVVSH